MRFSRPYQLDSNRCISYLTIEKRGSIPEELRAGMGRHVFGCDICQDVCPWNRKAPASSAPEFSAREGLVNPALDWLAEMSAEEFRETFRGSPIRRTKRSGLRRNAVIAMGNSANRRISPPSRSPRCWTRTSPSLRAPVGQIAARISATSGYERCLKATLIFAVSSPYFDPTGFRTSVTGFLAVPATNLSLRGS